MQMIETPKSSSILAYGYDKMTQRLHIQYYNKEMYIYKSVPHKVIESLTKADSMGKFINAHIKPNYHVEKVQND